MFVLGIDPGLSRCGYGLIEVGAKSRAVAAGVLTTDRSLPTPERLAQLQADFVDLVAQHRPDETALERVLFSANARTAMSVGQAAGVVMAEARRVGSDVFEYSPNEIKLAVCGHGRADKAQVESMVRRLLGLRDVVRPADAADALAVALTHAAHRPSRRAADRAIPGGTAPSR